MCFCVSAIPSMLWETGKQSPVGDGLLRSISYHQGNRAAPFVKLTFPGTIRECVCVCLYGFNIKANVNTTERKMHGGFPRKNMHVQNTNVRSSYKFRGKCFSYYSDADLYRFLCFCLVLSLQTCSAEELLCCVCCEQSLKVFQWPVMALLFMVLRWFYSWSIFYKGHQWKSIMVLLLFIIWKKTQIFFLVFFYSEV